MQFVSQQFQNRIYRDLGLIFLAAVVMTLPIFVFGITSGNDLFQHYQFAFTFYDSLQNGVLYPSLSASSNYGFGDVGVRFYPPFAYYVFAGFRWLAGNWYDASVLTFCFWFFAGGTGVYLWAREWFDNTSALFAGVAYMVIPYHANQIYNAFLYAEFAASAILPFCFLFVARICRGGKYLNVIGLAAAYALLVLTHLPMTVIGSISLLVYSLFSLKRETLVKTFAKLGAAVMLGLAASSFYWIRPLTEFDFVNHTAKAFSENSFDFHSNFLLSYFSVTYSEYIDRSLWFSDLMFVFTLSLFLPAAIFLSKNKHCTEMIPVAATAVCGLIFATQLSRPIWEISGLLQRTQFPWRWLSIITLCAAFFAAAGFRPLVEMFRSGSRPLALALIGFIACCFVFTLMQVIRPANFTPRAEFAEKIKNVSTAESCDCWWPAWAKKEAFLDRTAVSADRRQAEVLSDEPTKREYKISPGVEQAVRIGTFFYPYWHATVNGSETPIKKMPDGAMSVRIPAEGSDVMLSFIEPASAFYARLVSGLAWPFILLSGMIPVFHKFRQPKLAAL